jgi:hypothetical protein
MINGLTLIRDFYLGKLENPRRPFPNPRHKPVKLPTLMSGVSFVQPKKRSPPGERFCRNLTELSFRARPPPYQVEGQTPYQARTFENRDTGQAWGARPGIQERCGKSNHPGPRLASRFAGLGRDDELGHGSDRED